MVKAIEINNLKQTEIGTVPIEWNIVSLNGTSTLHARIGWQGLTTDEYRTSGKFKLVSGTSFQNGKINWKKCNYVDEIRYEQDKNIQLKDQDVLVTKDGTIGKVAYVKIENEKATLNSGVFVIRPKGNFYYPKFMYYIFSSHYFVDFLNKLTAGSTIIHLYQKDFINFTFPLPSYKEQQKIATALSDMDDLIESLEKIINKKKKIKQGTMQQLLTGKKRLPGFAEKWNEEKVENIASIQTGNKNTEDKVEGGKYPFYVRSSTVEKIDSYSYDEEAVLTAGDGVGTGRIFHYVNGKFDLHQRVYKIGDFANSIEAYYFYLYFSNNFFNRIKAMSAKSSVDSVRREMISRMNIKLPPIEEQKAISQVFFDMDAEIEQLEQKLEKYNKLKEGMMQELLTGRIRLV